MNIIQQITAEQKKTDVPEFKTGDTVRVHQIIQEGSKERIQIFEGVVLKRSGSGINESFTVRKISYNVGVERIYPLHSPRVSKIEVKQRGRVRRARIYYLRNLRGKAAKIEQEGINQNAASQKQSSTPAAAPQPQTAAANAE